MFRLCIPDVFRPLGENTMRQFVLIPLLLVAVRVDAATQPTAKEYLAMPVAQWLQLPYRKQIGSARAIAEENRLGMCRKRISDVVNCMREIGPTPAGKAATVKSLFTECSDEMDDTSLPPAGRDVHP